MAFSSNLRALFPADAAADAVPCCLETAGVFFVLCNQPVLMFSFLLPVLVSLVLLLSKDEKFFGDSFSPDQKVDDVSGSLWFQPVVGFASDASDEASDSDGDGDPSCVGVISFELSSPLIDPADLDAFKMDPAPPRNLTAEEKDELELDGRTCTGRRRARAPTNEETKALEQDELQARRNNDGTFDRKRAANILMFEE